MEITTVYNQFHQSLRSFIRGKVNTTADVDDILQDVFVKISGSMSSLSDNEKLTPWIYAITRNTIIDYYRRKSSPDNRLKIDENLEHTLPEEVNDESSHGLENCVHSLIMLLPERYRQIILDSEIHGVSQKDLALNYDMAYSSMRSRVQRAREHLKKLFYDCCTIHTDVRGNVLSAHGKADRASLCSSCGGSSCDEKIPE